MASSVRHHDDWQPTMAELCDALEMPRSGLEQWFAHLQAFCAQHGGARHYQDLMTLVRECQDALAED